MRDHSFICAVGFGPRILRAETAAAVGLALLQGAGWSPEGGRQAQEIHVQSG